MMELVKELSLAGFEVGMKTPRVHCKAFKGNSGALEMARNPKMRPRTKNLNIKHHHFREAVEDGLVSVHAIGTKDQLADIFTKPLPTEMFCGLRKKIMGW
jgi:hypothetical protein